MSILVRNFLSVDELKLQAALQEVALYVGPDILTLPVRVEYNLDAPPAYTTANGIWIRADVIEMDTEFVGVIIMHEIGHHIFKDDEATGHFLPDIVNMGEDFKINQWILETTRKDLRKMKTVKGICLDEKKFKCSVVEICEDLSKQNNVGYVGCGCRMIPNRVLLSQARRLRRKFNINSPDSHFHLDLVDEKKFIENIDAVRNQIKLPKVNVNLDRVVEGIWSHLFLEKPVAKPVKKFLTRSQVLSYCYPADYLRDEIQGRASECMFAASVFLRKVREDPFFVREKALAAKERYMEYRKEIKLRRKKGKRNKYKKTETSVLIQRRRNAKKSWQKWEATIPLEDLLVDKKYRVKAVSHRPNNRPFSLQSSMEEEEAVKLPFIAHNETTRAVSRISRRSFGDFRRVNALMQELRSKFRITLEEDGSINQAAPTNDLPEELEKEKAEQYKNNKRGKKDEKIDKSNETKKGTGKQSGEKGAGETGKGKAGDNRKSGKGESDQSGVNGGDNSLPLSDMESFKPDDQLDDLEKGVQPTIEKPNNGGGSSAGKGKGVVGKFNLMNLLYSNIEMMETIMFYMNEIDTKLKSKYNRNGSDTEDGQNANYSHGNDIENVMPEEIALLDDNFTKLEFLSRYANNSLLQVVPPAKKRAPLAILLDASGSMMGEPYAKAAGFALAMIMRLQKDNRGCILICFTGQITHELVILPNASFDAQKAVAMICAPHFGGTNFDAPLKRAYEIKKEQGWKSLFSMFITDGYGNFNKKEEFIRIKSPGDQIIAVIAAKTKTWDHLKPIVDDGYIAEKKGIDVALVKAGNNLL